MKKMMLLISLVIMSSLTMATDLVIPEIFNNATSEEVSIEVIQKHFDTAALLVTPSCEERDILAMKKMGDKLNSFIDDYKGENKQKVRSQILHVKTKLAAYEIQSRICQ